MVGCFKWFLIGHPGRTMENSGVEGDMECRTQIRSYRGTILMCSKDYSCEVFPKNRAGFSSCTKNLPEAKLMSIGSNISKQPSISHVTWLIVITRMHICNEKKQVEHGELQSVQFEGQAIPIRFCCSIEPK